MVASPVVSDEVLPTMGVRAKADGGASANQ